MKLAAEQVQKLPEAVKAISGAQIVDHSEKDGSGIDKVTHAVR
jgi:hypothetical protein